MSQLHPSHSPLPDDLEARSQALAERVYEVVAGEEDDRSCEAIGDDACQEVPGNFGLNVLNGTATKLAEQLASPGLVLPWILGAVGAPASLVGLLVPIRRAGALLPQLAIAGRIRARSRRKWYWVGAGAVQALSLLAMIPAILLLPPLPAGLAIIGSLTVFSMASGIGSVAFKDVMAKTIPRGRRGRMLGLRATGGGLLALVAAGALHLWVAEDDSLAPYVILLLAAGVLWLVASLLFAAIREFDGATAGGRHALEEARAGLHLLRTEPAFTRFVLTRSFLLAAQLAVPFYALQAQSVAGIEATNLALLVMSASLAAVLSAPFWGAFSDASARRVMVAGGLWSGATVAFALGAGFGPEGWIGILLFCGVFLSSGFAEAGVRLGRKTYLVDGAPEDQRPLMVAVANTVVGGMYAVAALLGLLADSTGVEVVLILLGVMALAGTILALTLPEAESLVPRPPGD